MPTQMDTSPLGYPDCPSQDPLDTVIDLKSKHSDSPKSMYTSPMQELHDDQRDITFELVEENFNIKLRPPESYSLGFGSKTSKDASPGFDCEDMASAEDDTEHSSSHGKGVRLPANNSGRNNCLVGLASYLDTSDATSCISTDVSDTGFDPNLSELRALREYVPSEGGCNRNPMDQFDEDTRLRPRSKLQSFNPRTTEMDLSALLLPENPFKDVPELSSDIERSELEKLQAEYPPDRDFFHTLLGYDDMMVSLHPPKLSQSSHYSLDCQHQVQNSLPVGGCDSPGQPGQPDKPGGVTRLRDDKRHPSLLQTTVRKCHKKSYQTQGPQEPPKKIPRIQDNTERTMPTAGFSVGGAAHNSGPQSRILLETSAPPLGVEAPQQSFLQTIFKAPTLHPEQPAVPPDQTCRVETKNNLGQMILARLAGPGSPSTNSDPVPEQQLSPEEQKKAKRRERNRETARKAREKLKNTETQLREEVETKRAELKSANDEIENLSKKQIYLQHCLDSHHCLHPYR